MFNEKKRVKDRRSNKRDDNHQKPQQSNEQVPGPDLDTGLKKKAPEPGARYKSTLPVRYYVQSNSS